MKRTLRERFNRLIGQKWIDIGLRAKMSVLVTIGIAGLTTIFTLLGIWSARQVTEQILSERVMLARMSAQTLDTTLHHTESVLTLVAGQIVPSETGDFQIVSSAGLDQIAAFQHGLYLIDRESRLRDTSGPEEFQIDWQRVPAVQAVLQGEDFAVSIDRSDLAGEKALVFIAVPVVDEHGQTVGSLAGLLDINDPNLFPAIHSFDLGGTGALEVVDSTGFVLLSTNPDHASTVDQNEALVRLFGGDRPGVETCLGCYGDEATEGRDEIVAFAPMGHAEWGVAVRQKAADVFAPVRSLLLENVILGLVTAVGALVLVWVTTNSVIKPVQTLTQAAQRIAGGDLKTPLSYPSSRLSRRDEIGMLAHSFGIMHRQLRLSMEEIRALNRDLDLRVQERTLEARLAQKEAQAMRDDLRAIIDAMEDELVVIGVEDERIQQVNQAVLKRFDSDTEIIGRPFSEIFTCQEPGSEDGCGCPISLILETGKSVQVIHTHPGTEPGQARYIDIVASPMFDASGKITRIVELMRDVTEERRLKESLIRRNQELSILNTVAMTVNKSLDLDQILGQALEEVMRLTDVDAGAVFLREDIIGKLELIAYRGLSEQAARIASEMGMLDGSCGGVVEKGQMVLVPDISGYRGRRAASLKREKLNSLVHVPLTAKGNVLGSMCVGTRRLKALEPNQRELLNVIGNQIAASVENARLYAEVQQKEKMRGELFKKSINAQEEERRRIARELHDDTSQALTALIFAAEEALEMDQISDVHQRLSRMRDLAQSTLDGVHKLIFDLRPTMLDHLGLVPALRWFAESRLKPKGARVSIRETSQPCRLPAEVETALFRVVQEAITNIARHAAARNVNIVFEFEDDTAAVFVEDDGVGFNMFEPTLSPDTGRGLGLMGMQERLELLDGDLEINSAPGVGTRLYIQVPIESRRMVNVH